MHVDLPTQLHGMEFGHRGDLTFVMGACKTNAV